jgi:dihydrofolate reductase
MRKIILDLAVTVDSLIEGPNGEYDWCILDEESGLESFLESIDTIFYGRVSYELFGNYQPDEQAPPLFKSLFQAVHSKQKYVFSKSSKGDGKATFINDGDIVKAVEQIRQQPGKDIWLYGGASLLTTFMKLGLVDEYRLAVHPLILGGGKQLFADLKGRVELELKKTNVARSGVVQLIYAAKRP